LYENIGGGLFPPIWQTTYSEKSSSYKIPKMLRKYNKHESQGNEE
jgi:hypothetical protein